MENIKLCNWRSIVHYMKLVNLELIYLTPDNKTVRAIAEKAYKFLVKNESGLLKIVGWYGIYDREI